MILVLWTWLRTLKTAAKIAACSKMAVRTAVKVVAKVAVKKIGYDLGYEDGCELGCKLGMSDGYKHVKEKKERCMQRRREHGETHEWAQHRQVFRQLSEHNT
jgi:hypothetical protein